MEKYAKHLITLLLAGLFAILMSFLCSSIIDMVSEQYEEIIYFSSFLISTIIIFIFYYFIAPPLITYLSLKNLNSLPKDFNNLYFNLCKKYNRSLKKMQYILLIKEVLEALAIFSVVSYLYTNYIFLSSNYPILIILIVIILYIISFLLTKNLSNTYTEFYKNNVIKSLINSFNEDLEYSPFVYDNNAVYNLYENSKFPIQYFTSFSADDHVYGQIDNNMPIDMFNLFIERSNSRRDNHTVFSGLFLTEKCNINIPEYVQVLKYEIPNNINNVATDNADFNKLFRLYCNDNILAMNIFTPDILDFITKFYITYKINFEISIYQDSIYFKFYTGQMFEPNIIGSPLNKLSLYNYYYSVQFVLELTKMINKTINSLDYLN